MGTRFRKSKNFGPFRINFSKSGVGYSYGNKYARVTHTADGKKRTTYTIPGTGISWQETEKRRQEKPQIEQNAEPDQKTQNKWFVIFILALVGFFIFMVLIQPK